MQELPAAGPDIDELRQRLTRSYLQYDLQGVAADVAAAGMWMYKGRHAFE